MKQQRLSPARLGVVIGFLIVVCIIYLVALFDMQVVHGATWANYAENHRLVARNVEASRGRIMDRHEADLVSNRAVNNIVLDWVVLANSPANTNDTLLEMVRLAESMGYVHTDTLAITHSPLQYTAMSPAQEWHLNRFMLHYDRSLRNMIRTMQAEDLLADNNDTEAPPSVPDELNVDTVSAVQLMAFLRQQYRIDPEYTAAETRIIAGIRYEIDLRTIIGMDEYIFIEDASVRLISAFLERNFPGVTVQPSSVRRYNTTVAAHVLGRVGPITAENLHLFEDYPLDAQVGQDGLERDFQPWLRGTNGRVVQTVTADGVVIGEHFTRDAQPGGNVVTTIDSGLQAVAEAALRSTIRQINAERGPQEIHQATGGAVVAIDPRNGEVLAIASVPTFSLEGFSDNFAALLDETGNPLFNRATMGAYEPGSTFKMVTALAGLYYGSITEHTTIPCDGAFWEFAEHDYIPRCMGIHGNIDLRGAIAHSCNVYFFQVAYWVGMERMADFAERFGLGDLTGIGFGEVPGQRSTWDTMIALNRDLRPDDPFYHNNVFDGQIIQIGIGQGVSMFTPLQLANYTAMIASGGVRFQPTLLREVRSYDGRHVLYVNEPVVMYDIRDHLTPEQVELVDAWFLSLQEGMRLTSTHGTAASQLANFRHPVASKTGTVEVRADDEDGPYSHGVFIAYAPFDDPQIAIAVVIEHGGRGGAGIPIATAMFDHFFRDQVVDQRLPVENVLLR